jgi:hypothetical protein
VISIADGPVFPSNAIDLTKTRAALIDPDLFVTGRPLRESDPVQSVGVFGTRWLPDEESYEMKGAPAGRHEPTLQSYLITVQGFVKDMDEERGLIVHSILSKKLRAMLYRDDPLRVGLLALSVNMSGSTERATRFGVRTQQFVSNELNGSWLYLSTLEYWLETETV